MNPAIPDHDQVVEGLRDSLREQLQHLRNDTERIGAETAGYPTVPILHAANLILLEWLIMPEAGEFLGAAVDAALDELARTVLGRMGK